MSTKETGNKAEEIAAEYLARKGYSILERNWQYRHKEIDIIARDGVFLVIAEVKSRRQNYLKHPEEAVNRQKQRYLIEAANAYIERQNLDLEARFDIVSVIFTREGPKIIHIDDAFYPIFR